MDSVQKALSEGIEIPLKNDDVILQVQKSIIDQNFTDPISKKLIAPRVNFSTQEKTPKDEISFKIVNGTKFYKVPKKPKAVKHVRKRRGHPFKKNV